MTTVNPFMTGSSSKSAKDNQQTAQSADQPPARLCYVDDSRTSAYVVKRLLRPYGYLVDHFDSAEPALIALVKDNYDLLLTDLKVSPTGMDGDDLVRALRNSGHEKISSLPVIVITGATDETVLKEVYEAGANQILSKPVNGDELDTHIRNLVNGANAEDAVGNSIADEPTDSATVAKISESTGTTAVTATVVPFGTEAINQKSQPSQSEEDNIPVLSTLDERPKESTDSKPVTGGSGSSIGGKRRVLKSSNAAQLSNGMSIPNIGGNKKITPKPVISVKPASRVTPSIAAPKTAEAVKNEKPRNALPVSKSAEGDQNLNDGSQPNLTPEQIVAKQKLLKAKELAKKRKVLAEAAARKRAGQVTMPGSVSTASQGQPKGQPQAKPKFDINKIPTDHLSLAPRDNETAEEQETGRVRSPAAPTVAPRSPLNPEVESTQSEAVNDFAAAAGIGAVAQPSAIPETPQTAKSQHPESNSEFQSQFQAEVDAATNILQEMERYPLVEADLSSNYTPSRVMSAVGSILELYGPKKIIAAIVLIAAGFFAYNTWKEYFDDGLAVDVTAVEQGEIFQSITVPGKVVSKLRVNLTPAIAGRLTHVYVEEGDTVKSGDLLARLDDREAKSFLKRANASYESAKEDVLLAARSLKRLKQAFEKGAIAKRLVEEAEVELRSAKAREAIVEEEVRTAKLSLENPRIVAPFAGTITARYVEVGQWVVPSETLFTLIDEKQREVEVQVDAADSGGIAVGQTVTLSSDAFPGLEWNESVTRLAAATSNVGNANTVSVYISLGNNAPSLRFGQQVDADIRTAWNPNALKLPFGAITNRSGKSYVATIQNNKVHFVEVVTGIEDFSHVEILQGVNSGQPVIMANGLDLQENQKVFVAASNAP